MNRKDTIFPSVQLVLALILSCSVAGRAQSDSVCARVRIEINQELTLERQGFEARMNLTNGNSGALTNLSVVVNFADANKNPVAATSDPNNTTAKFFIRLTSSATLPDTLATNAQGQFRWLIVPALAAGGADPAGTLYYVGAKLNYTLNGVATSIDVLPDSIRVKPMPQLSLDYFLPYDVYGDDPFTPQVEPSIPFSLGVRVKNSGYGEAHQLKIESSQPKIIDNRQGLAVKFAITGSEVNGQPATSSLLADFGTVSPNRSGVGRWIMTSSLYGRFVDFSAAFTHSNDLGGTLTSLITGVNTHRLLQVVLVDLPGRDSIRDFLAMDDDGSIKVYESENTDTPVTDLSEGAVLLNTGHYFALIPPYIEDDAPDSSGLSYIKITDPLQGTKAIYSVVRADGKLLNPNNTWLSSTYLPDTQQWNYFLNVFDINNTDGLAYTVTMGASTGINHPPVLRQPTRRLAQAGSPLNFYVAATDPDNDPITISAGALPAGASFAQIEPGYGLLTWTPTAGQTGIQQIQFSVSDGDLSDTKTAQITVSSGAPRPSWAGLFWPGVTDTSIIGMTADPDHDGMPNLVEYALGLDPTYGDLYGAPEPIIVTVGGQQYLAIRFIARTDDSGLLISSEVSDAPGGTTWQTATDTVPQDQNDISTGFQRFVIRDSVPITTGSPRRFIRLRVNLN